jgi:hypothetical protein
LFTTAVLDFKKAHTVMGTGLMLDELAVIFTKFSLTTRVVHADKSSLTEFRKLAVGALKTDKDYVIVNFARKDLHQDGGGHFSPLAAYDEASDRFLILDVARYKYPPAWAKAVDLWTAMNSEDSTKTAKRGFMIVSGTANPKVRGTLSLPQEKTIRQQYFGTQLAN